MKSKLILMCAVVAISLSLFACFPTPKQVSVEATDDDFMKLHAISKEVEVAVEEQVAHKFVSPEREPPPPPGTPGKEVWTFKALKQGKSIISMEYSRPWEGGTKAEWTFVLTVVVK